MNGYAFPFICKQTLPMASASITIQKIKMLKGSLVMYLYLIILVVVVVYLCSDGCMYVC